MRIALREAEQAAFAGEVPVGAVCLDSQGNILSQVGNRTISMADPTAHAEILALRLAAKKVGNYRLPGAFLVVTLEPCLMCLGALIQARLAGVIFGAYDSRFGALVSNLDGSSLPFANHHFAVKGGVLEQECAALLKDFFKKKRQK